MKRNLVNRLALAGLFGAMAVGAAWAQPPVAQSVPVAAGPVQPARHAASNVLEEAITRLNLFVASGRAQNPAEMQRFVDETVKPFFDFERMAKLVAGPTWGQMNPQQRAQFVSRVQDMFLKSFVRNVVSYRGIPPRVQFLPPRPSKDASRIDLMARLLFPKGKTRRMVFRFAKSGDKWRAFDVSVDGKSAVLYYRSHFMKLARDGGIPAMLAY